MTETTSSLLGNVITIDDERIKRHLERVVRGSVVDVERTDAYQSWRGITSGTYVSANGLSA